MAEALGPYSPIVRSGDWLMVSGQIGLVDGHMVNGGLQAELHQALRNIETLLASEGASIGDIVKTTVYLLHMRDFPLMNETYAAFFGDHRPARSCVAVVELPGRALVEVEVWARLAN